MRCRRCESDNPEGAKFCIECDDALSRRCAQCGFENLPRAKFCAECGASLGAQSTSSVSSQKPVLLAPVPQAQVSPVEGFQVPSFPQSPAPNTEPPVSYTPTHLADPSLRSLPVATREAGSTTVRPE
ncbi:MAG: zinc ribbon domain-containing protein [Candidatus Binatia bacterium]